MLKQIVVVTLVGMATVGCSGGDLSGTLGELGEGVFRYNCIEDGDARCVETDAVSSLEVSTTLGIDPELPSAIAVGARFDLTYVGSTIDDGEFLIVDVEPARPDFVTHAAGFVIETPGTFAFLARNGPKKIIADFVHIDALDVASLDLWHGEQLKSTLDLTMTETTFVAAVPVDSSGIALAGAMSLAWSSSDVSIVAVGSPTSTDTPSSDTLINDNEIRIAAVAEGTATLTVTHGELSTELTITVAPEVMP